MLALSLFFVSFPQSVSRSPPSAICHVPSGSVLFLSNASSAHAPNWPWVRSVMGHGHSQSPLFMRFGLAVAAAVCTGTQNYRRPLEAVYLCTLPFTYKSAASTTDCTWVVPSSYKHSAPLQHKAKLLKPDGATTVGGSSFPILLGYHSQSRLSDELLPPLPLLPGPNVHLPNGPRLHLPIFCHGWRLAQTLSTSFIAVSRHNLHHLTSIYGYGYVFALIRVVPNHDYPDRLNSQSTQTCTLRFVPTLQTAISGSTCE